jgi:selenocysteine-specific elongation factor
MELLRSAFDADVPPRVFRWCVDGLVAAGRVARTDSVVRAPGHRVGLDDDARALGERIEAALADGGLTPPDVRELEARLAVDRRRLADVLGVLERERRVVRVSPDLYYAPAAAEDAKARLATHCRAHGEISAATFRDLIGASRKFAIAFLDWCDRTGVTTRVGDVRRLRR